MQPSCSRTSFDRAWPTIDDHGALDQDQRVRAASGFEIDRYDLSLGTPPHTLIVASSGGHSDNYQTVVEEVLYPYPGLSGSHDHHIRADISGSPAS
jgi:hypothetical protein